MFSKKKHFILFITKIMLYQRNSVEVKSVRMLTESTYVLELVRNQFAFKAGQFVCLGVNEQNQLREYSIYSGENDTSLTVLIKEIEDGIVSSLLKDCKAGQQIRFAGPLGEFVLNESALATTKYMFIATGTGIAPFHSFICTHPNIDYQVLLGVKYAHEGYDKEDYATDRFTLCTSQDAAGDYHGRVTDYLRQHPPVEQYEYYLCGNGKMIYEAIDILRSQQVPDERIHFELYF